VTFGSGKRAAIAGDTGATETTAGVGGSGGRLSVGGGGGLVAKRGGGDEDAGTTGAGSEGTTTTAAGRGGGSCVGGGAAGRDLGIGVEQAPTKSASPRAAPIAHRDRALPSRPEARIAVPSRQLR
jgi:hypothetical protein